MMKNLLLTIALAGFVGFIAYFSLKDFDAAALSLHGWIALGLGCGLSLLVGGGLMALAFHSARKGFDDRIGEDRGEAP
jgi:hypothetical protein